MRKVHLLQSDYFHGLTFSDCCGHITSSCKDDSRKCKWEIESGNGNGNEELEIWKQIVRGRPFWTISCERRKERHRKGKDRDHVHRIVQVPNIENDYFLNYSIFGKSSENHLISAWFPERKMHDFPWLLSDFRKMHDFDFKHFPFFHFQEMHGFPWFLKDFVLEL